MEAKQTHEMAKRIADYRIEQRTFWLNEFPLLAALTIIFSFGLSYLCISFMGPMIADWRVVSALFSIAMLIPPVWMMAPEKPTLEAAEYDNLLNQIGAELRIK